MLCNFPLFAYSLNKDCYAEQSVSVESKGYDGLIALVPKIKVSYDYNGKDYEADFPYLMS